MFKTITKLLALFMFIPMLSFASELVFFENMEDVNFTEHPMERSYTTSYLTSWEDMKNSVFRSTDAYSGSFSATLDLFGSAAGRTIGVPNLAYGNTQNFNLSSAITGTQLFLRWHQKYEQGIDWGGFHSKQVYLNYNGVGAFVVTLQKESSANWSLSIHSNDPYEYTRRVYFSSPETDDNQWHTFEAFFDWTGQENGGDCVQESTLNFNSTNGTGIFSFKIDGVVVYQDNQVCYQKKAISGAPIQQIGWPSNLSGTGGSGTAMTWVDDLEIWDGLPGAVTPPPIAAIAPPSNLRILTGN